MQQLAVWLAAFLWTLALELPVYAVLLKDRLRSPMQAFEMVLTLNLVTHPALSIMHPRSMTAIIVAETGVAIVEGLAVSLWLGPRALVSGLIASFMANALSTTAGLGFSAWLS